jgi:hypothetical protein
MPLEPQNLPVYPPCAKCGSTTSCPCPAYGPDTPLEQVEGTFRSRSGQPGPTVTVATLYPGARKADWEFSVQIWREQAQAEEDERRRIKAEREYEQRKNRRF